ALQGIFNKAVANEKARKALGTGKIKQLERVRTKILPTLTQEVIERLTGLVDAKSNITRRKVGSTEHDRSAGILIFYTLWKLQASFGQARWAATDLRAKTQQLIKSKINAAATYIMTPKPNVWAKKRVKGKEDYIYGPAYSASGGAQPTLLSGYLMTRIWQSNDYNALLKGDAEILEQWQKYLSENYYDWIGRRSNTLSWQTWYSLVYLSRMVEVIDSQLASAGETTSNANIYALKKKVYQLILDRLKSKTLSVLKRQAGKYNKYGTTFYLITLETLSKVK
ncbi:MAG: hypothetical protein P1V97_34160, partial [Planctomycetota bacterium]|nr:hypothetical protein [Planctomycetota bacterium]